ncbi:MAG: 2-oxoacid:acceptor oxidoreductase family protein [Oscillospiraceae bacterium]|jgi:2-oxoglutarate ferredoxin oxidoreductase subunit gamma|nr:2-oxoacid:acceptor oxidoreductase family protein [Oscillospiraceae bacterium]
MSVKDTNVFERGSDVADRENAERDLPVTVRRDVNTVLAGFGGQGILFMGKVIAYAGLLDGREVSWLPSYGPEMRGGTANCSVCISDAQIGCPLVTAPDALIVMNQPSFEKFVPTVKPGGVIVVESSIITAKVECNNVAVHYVPATTLAEQHGLKGLANIILMGKLLAAAGFCSVETMTETIKKIVPARKAHLIPKNIEAIELGMKA